MTASADDASNDAQSQGAQSPVQATGGMEPATRGFVLAFVAYLLWGILPFYMKAVAHIPAVEVVAHRAIWSVPIAGAILLWFGRDAEIRRVLVNPRYLAMGLLTSALISVNWTMYVWAIGVGRTLETSLGYYINPLLSVLVGAVLLGEKLTRSQIGAIALAALAVAILTWETGGLPWISIGLSVSWAFYAYFKKTLPIGGTQSFFLEATILSVPGFFYVVWLSFQGESHFGPTGWIDVALLISAGIVTAVPLLLYANGAKLLRLSTIGIMQYIAPTMVFLIAVFVFHEPFSAEKAVAFALIWAALVIYSWSVFFGRRRG